MSSVTFHALGVSANSASTRAFLSASGIDFTEEEAYGKTRTPEFIAKFPLNLAPAISHGDVHIGENLAIMRYLAKVFPDKAGKFIPADPVLAAKIDMVANYEPHVYSFIAKSAYPSLGFPLYAGDVATMDSTKENVAEAAAAAGSELLNIYENKFVNIFLKDTKFLLSDELTIADFRHAPVMLFAKIGCVLPARLEQYLKDVEAAAPGYAEAVAGTTGFASPHWKK